MQDLGQRTHGAEVHPTPTRQLSVSGLQAPVHSPTGRLLCTRQRGTNHDGIGTTGNSARYVTAATDTAIGNHVHIAATALIEIVAPGGSNIRDR